MSHKKITYQQAREDHTYLWEVYAPAVDMTGGYQDQNDLHRLLKQPTRAMARDCYVDQIEYWFQAGPDTQDDDWSTDPKVQEIAERHFCTDGLDGLRRMWE